jgi:DNA-binding GntR family transcriptional regulator
MGQDKKEFQRPKTAQEAVLDEIRNAISTGRLKPGTPVRQDALANELGVSRVPVREALRILEGEGQVLYRPYKGYVIAELDLHEVNELYMIRRLLESEAIKAGVPHLTDEQLTTLETLVEDMEVLDDSDIDLLARLNHEFHFLIFEACGLTRLIHHIRLLWDASNAYRSVYFLNEHHHQQVHDEHRMLLEAARRRDAAGVIAIQDKHRDSALDFLHRSLQAASDLKASENQTSPVEK